MDPLTSLTAASITLIGTHFVLSHPLRASLVRALGPTGFMVAYSLVAAVCMVWIALAFRASPPADLGGATGDAGWLLATVLTLPALVLFLGSFRGNPALPAPSAEAAATQAPHGVFHVTRHPMMWGFALWALSHIVLWWSWRTVIVGCAILVLALVGAHLQDGKKEALMGAAWQGWEAKTSYWPRWGRLLGASAVLWLFATAAWLALTWAHLGAAGVQAGVWRWLG